MAIAVERHQSPNAPQHPYDGNLQRPARVVGDQTSGKLPLLAPEPFRSSLTTSTPLKRRNRVNWAMTVLVQTVVSNALCPGFGGPVTTAEHPDRRWAQMPPSFLSGGNPRRLRNGQMTADLSDVVKGGSTLWPGLSKRWSGKGWALLAAASPDQEDHKHLSLH